MLFPRLWLLPECLSQEWPPPGPTANLGETLLPPQGGQPSTSPRLSHTKGGSPRTVRGTGVGRRKKPRVSTCEVWSMQQDMPDPGAAEGPYSSTQAHFVGHTHTHIHNGCWTHLVHRSSCGVIAMMPTCTCMFHVVHT